MRSVSILIIAFLALHSACSVAVPYSKSKHHASNNKYHSAMVQSMKSSGSAEPGNMNKALLDVKAEVVSALIVLPISALIWWVNKSTPKPSSKFAIAYKRFDSTILNELEREAKNKGNASELEIKYGEAYDDFLREYKGSKLLISEEIMKSRDRTTLRAIDDAARIRYGRKSLYKDKRGRL